MLFTIGTSRFLSADVFHKTNTALPQEIWNNAQQPFTAAQDRAWGAALTLIMLVFLCTFIGAGRDRALLEVRGLSEDRLRLRARLRGPTRG